MEPPRILQMWFLRRGSTLRRALAQNRGRLPPLCDFVWTSTSPAFRALQVHVSGMLAGRSSCLKLLYGRTHGTLKVWAPDKRDDAEQCGRSVNVASSWVDMRHLRDSFEVPWLDAAVIDLRRPLQERRSIGSKVFQDTCRAARRVAWPCPRQYLDEQQRP